MEHPRRKLTQSSGKTHTSASPYNYYGRTHDRPLHDAMKVVSPPHPGGHHPRRHVKNVSKHGLKSWSDRGYGPKASYKE